MKQIKIWILFLIFLAGCASNLDQGVNLIEQGDYEEAVQYLEAASKEDIDQIKTERKLAIAYYKNKQYKDAENKLKSVIDRTPNNSIAHMYLGMTYEAEQLYNEAIGEYRSYIALCQFEEIRQQFIARLELLKQKAIAQEIKNALENEANLLVDRVKPNTFAVKYFNKLYGPEELDVLEKGLTDLLISDLAQIEGITVVERTRMQHLINEIKLRENTSLFDPKSSPRVGKLLGADNIITGTLEGKIQDEEVLTITAVCGRIDGSEYEAVEKEGFLKEVFELEKKVLAELLQKAGVKISPQKLAELGQPTRSLEAFLSYSQGLDYMDQGFYDAAAKEFQNAIALDPKFTSAQETLTKAQNLSIATKQNLDEIEKTVNEAERNMQSTSERGAKANSVLSKGFTQFPGTSYNASDTSSKEEAEKVPVELEIEW